MIGSSALGLIFVSLAGVGVIRGNDTLTTVCTPLFAMFTSFPALISLNISDPPRQGPLDEAQLVARRQAQLRRAERRLLWLYTALGSVFMAWYLVRNVFWDAGWLVLAPMGLAGFVWCGLAIFGWRQVKTASATTPTMS